MSHNWCPHVPTQYPGSANQLPFNQSSRGSKPGSLSGSKGIRLGLSSVRLIHSKREDADMLTGRSSRVITSQVETSRRALKRTQTKKKDKTISQCLPDRTKLEKTNITVRWFQPADGYWRLLQLNHPSEFNPGTVTDSDSAMWGLCWHIVLCSFQSLQTISRSVP
jgi:hypothetical protein